MATFNQSGQKVGTQINIDRDGNTTVIQSNIGNGNIFSVTGNITINTSGKVKSKNIYEHMKYMCGDDNSVVIDTNKDGIRELLEIISDEYEVFIHYNFFKGDLTTRDLPRHLIKVTQDKTDQNHICDITIIDHEIFEIYHDHIKYTKLYDK
jgi:hypothetical protein